MEDLDLNAIQLQTGICSPHGLKSRSLIDNGLANSSWLFIKQTTLVSKYLVSQQNSQALISPNVTLPNLRSASGVPLLQETLLLPVKKD